MISVMRSGAVAGYAGCSIFSENGGVIHVVGLGWRLLPFGALLLDSEAYDVLHNQMVLRHSFGRSTDG